MKVYILSITSLPLTFYFSSISTLTFLKISALIFQLSLLFSSAFFPFLLACLCFLSFSSTLLLLLPYALWRMLAFCFVAHLCNNTGPQWNISASLEWISWRNNESQEKPNTLKFHLVPLKGWIFTRSVQYFYV